MQVRESFARDMLRLLVWYPLRWVLTIIPVRWGIGLLSLMGDLHYTAARGSRKRLRENLGLMLPTLAPREAEDAVRQYFRNHYVDHLLIFIFPRFGVGETERFAEIENLGYLRDALQGGKGAILVHGHFGPVHLPLVALARLGFPMKQIGLPTDEGLSWIGRNVAFRLRMSYEAKMPAEIIMADGFLRSAFRWLKGNGVIMITGDGSGTETKVGKHETFPFFDKKVSFPLGPAILAGKTGAQILPLFIVPGEKKTYRIIIERPLTSSGSGEERARDITAQFVRRLEQRITGFPGWMHFLDRLCTGCLIEGPQSKPAPPPPPMRAQGKQVRSSRE